ncbi:MAG TPA: 50S ribosomal protein L7 [Firmicutes bacterium]|nr:50S ribosomal protein L7 [Bacillota bacterium]HBR35226.1 50S ribosomal protein L7 [Bacillota bacterium]
MNNLLNFLGIARKAGKLALGYTATSLALKKGAVTIVILATDLSPHTKEKIERLCRKDQIRLYSVAKQEELGRAVGKTSQAVIGVLSPEIAKAIENQLVQARTE